MGSTSFGRHIITNFFYLLIASHDEAPNRFCLTVFISIIYTYYLTFPFLRMVKKTYISHTLHTFPCEAPSSWGASRASFPPKEALLCKKEVLPSKGGLTSYEVLRTRRRYEAPQDLLYRPTKEIGREEVGGKQVGEIQRRK